MELTRLQNSDLVQCAGEAQRNTPIWLAYVLFLIVGLGILTIGVSVLLDAILPTESGSFASHAKEAIMFGLQILFLYLWLKFHERREFSSIGWRGKGKLAKFATGLAIGAVMNLATAGLLIFLGGYTFVGSAPDPNIFAPIGVLVLISLVIVTIQATGEEMWFRGFLLQTGARKLPGLLAILLPAVVFWLTHMIFNPFGAINIVMFAVFAALIALKQGSLITVAGIHTGWNWFMGNVIGAPVSGIEPREATIFIVAPNSDAPAHLTGSGLGLEGTVACSIVWAISVALAYMYFRTPEGATPMKDTNLETK